jgi:hypothetical protein
LWAPLGELTTELATGRLFADGYLGWVAPVGALGLLLVGLRARVFGRLVVILFCGILVAASEEAITVLRLDLLLSAFKNLQFPRYAIALKPLWFAMAGVGAAVVGRALAREVTIRLERPMAERVLVAILVGPLVAATLAGASRLMPRPVGSVDTLDRSSLTEREALLHRALRKEREALGRPLRVAFLRTGMSGATYPLMALADEGAAVVLDGHIPSVNFRYRLKRRPVSLLTGLGVTHVIYDGRLRKPEKDLSAHLKEVESHGRLHLARLEPDDTPSEPAWFPRNSGQVQVLDEDAGYRSFALESVKTGARPAILRMLQAPYWRWEATLNGETLELHEASLFGGAMTGTRIDVSGDGTLELRYARREDESRAAIASGLLLLLCLGGLAVRRPIPMAERIQPPMARRLTLAMGGLAAIVLLAGGARRQQRLLAQTWEKVPPRRSATETFTRDLVTDGAYTTWRAPGETCEALQGKDARSGCSRAEMRSRISAMYRAPYLYRCVRVVIPPHGLARVFLEPGPNEDVVGFVRRIERRGSGKNIKWRIGTDDPTQRLENDLRVFSVDAGTREVVDVRFSNSSRHPEPVCVAAAAFH